MPSIDFTRDEVRELLALWHAAAGRFPESLYSAGQKLQDALDARPALFAPPAPTLLAHTRPPAELVALFDQAVAAGVLPAKLRVAFEDWRAGARVSPGVADYYAAAFRRYLAAGRPCAPPGAEVSPPDAS